MDLQAVDAEETKQNTLSKLTAAFCLTLTVLLLIGSLVSPGRASIHDNPTNTRAVESQLLR